MANTDNRAGIFLEPGEGRVYEMGGMTAVFKADGDETANLYNVSEWWLEPHTQGPPAHSHPEDDVFYVIEGVMHFQVGEDWIEAPKGAFVLAPGGVTHTFENRSSQRAGALNLGTPGGFEKHMPAIVEWFAKSPPGKA